MQAQADRERDSEQLRIAEGHPTVPISGMQQLHKLADVNDRAFSKRLHP